MLKPSFIFLVSVQLKHQPEPGELSKIEKEKKKRNKNALSSPSTSEARMPEEKVTTDTTMKIAPRKTRSSVGEASPKFVLHTPNLEQLAFTDVKHGDGWDPVGVSARTILCAAGYGECHTLWYGFSAVPVLCSSTEYE